MRTTILAAAAAIATLALTACGPVEGTATEARAALDTVAVEPAATFTAPTGRWTPPPAPIVDSNDQLFIQLLDTQGVDYTSKTDAIADAQHTCDSFDTGASVMDLAKVAITDGGMTPEDAGFFIGASVGIYCIQHQPLINAFANTYGGN